MGPTAVCAEPKEKVSPSSTGTWWVCQTVSKAEHRLARDFDFARLDYFLPVVRVRKFRKDRGREYKTTVSEAVYPGYVFLNARDGTAVDVAYKSVALSRIIPVINQDQLSRDLANLMDAMARDAHFGTPEIIRKGSRVKIVRGPLIGLYGIATDECRGKLHVQLAVEMMGRAVPSEVQVDFVELI